MRFRPVHLGDLEIEDEGSFSHVGLYDDLKRVASDHRLSFLVPERGELPWDDVALLNLTYWTPGVADVLAGPRIPADVVAHVVWHHLCARSLPPGMKANLLGESVASAFDFYLVGRLLGQRPDSAFLETQVPRMAAAAEDAGADPAELEALLGEAAAEPERAFEDLRELLFDTSLALAEAGSIDEAAAALARAKEHRFGSIVHHYELSNWVVRSKLERATAGAPKDESAAASVDRALREAPDAVAWLEEHWVQPALEADSAAISLGVK
ncbi:MAG: hypothetical protein JNL21_02080 [Myxococcales bacterium]|nr:hypothetical protein [Myxococcales bacterium]